MIADINYGTTNEKSHGDTRVTETRVTENPSDPTTNRQSWNRVVWIIGDQLAKNASSISREPSQILIILISTKTAHHRDFNQFNQYFRTKFNQYFRTKAISRTKTFSRIHRDFNQFNQYFRTKFNQCFRTKAISRTKTFSR